MRRQRVLGEVVSRLVIIFSSISSLASAAVLGERAPLTFQVVRYLGAWILGGPPESQFLDRGRATLQLCSSPRGSWGTTPYHGVSR